MRLRQARPPSASVFLRHPPEGLYGTVQDCRQGGSAVFTFSTDIGIDLGTATVLVYVKGKGIVVREPSVVAVDRDSGTLLAVGEDARRMIGRTPGNIIAIRPLRDGVIANYDITEAMLKHFIQKSCGRHPLLRPQVVVCVPSGVTSVEKRAVLEACTQAGAKKVILIEEPMAAAIGAGLNVSEASGSMVVDVGGGTTDIAVISLGGIVVSESLRLGGDKFDDAVCRYLKRNYNLMVGERTAEEVKIAIGSAVPDDEVRAMEVRGRDLVTGLPRTINFSSREAYEALAESVSTVVNGVKTVLEMTPPELAADIIDKGIVMTGGGALLRNFDRLLADETGIPVFTADDPASCVALGAGAVLDGVRGLRPNMLVSRKTG